MTCKINADTSDGLKITSDTSGAVDIQSNGTTKVSIDSSGNISTVAGMSTSNGNIAPLRPNAKPLIINGDMNIAQRGASVASITASGFNTVDRMNLAISSFGTWTQTQDTTVPTAKGFTKSLKMDCTTVEGSPSAGDYLAFQSKIEAQDLQLLKYGTSSAEALTLKFYVRSPKTGTHIVHFYSQDGNRHISQAYTISSADTFQEVIINIPGDTGGTINNDNGLGFNIEWYFGAGSNSTSGTLATSWASYVAANVAVGQVNCADNTANNFFITGIQMEVGEYNATTIPPFQHESFGDNLSRCQRYFCKSYDYDIAPATSGNINGSIASRNYAYTGDGSPFIHGDFPVNMRDNPTVTTFDSGGNSGKIGGPSGASITATVYQIGMSGFNVLNSSGSSVSGGDYYVNFKAESEL